MWRQDFNLYTMPLVDQESTVGSESERIMLYSKQAARMTRLHQFERIMKVRRYSNIHGRAEKAQREGLLAWFGDFQSELDRVGEISPLVLNLIDAELWKRRRRTPLLNEELTLLAMEKLSINKMEAQLMVEPLIQRAEKIWEKEGISMSEGAKRKFLRALVGAYEEMAKDFVKSIE